MLGRKLRCRLDLLYKSDEDVVYEKQDRAIQNYNGSMNKVFDINYKVMIKCYKPGNTESWIRATIYKVLGRKIYECKSNDD